MEGTHWYYISPRDKSQVGPLTLDDMKEVYQRGEVTEDTYAWHEDAEEWAKLRELKFNSQTLREIIAFSTAPGKTVSSELEKAVAEELAKRVERIRDSGEVDIEERIRENRHRTNTQTSRVSHAKTKGKKSPTPESSSESVSATQSSDDSDLEAAWDWVERTAEDGKPSFMNVRTGQSTTQRPDILEELYWVPDAQEGYVAVRLLSGLKLRAETVDTRSIVPLTEEMLPTLQKFHKGLMASTVSVRGK